MSRKMPITAHGTSKPASKPQPATSVEPAGPKCVENSINVLRQPLETTSDADEAQCPMPSQKTMITRPKRDPAINPSTAKTIKEWSAEEEDSGTAFAKRSTIARTPTQQCCMPRDVAIAMTPKKKETTLTTKLRGASTTAQPHKQSDEANDMPAPKNFMEALKKAHAASVLRQSMPPKKSGNDGTRKNPTPAAESKPPKPTGSEIAVQDAPKPPKQKHAALEVSGACEKILHNIDQSSARAETPLQEAQDLLFHSLKKLQTIYDDACEAKTEKITIELATFTLIGNMLQKAWENTRAAQREECKALNALMQIQTSISHVEQKYKDIQAKTTENAEMVFAKLNEIQSATTSIENKHEVIERTVKEAPKTYADIIRASTTKEKATTERCVQQRQQRDTLRQEQAKYEVTLTMKETTDEVKELINTMPPKEITERCQRAIENASISDIKLQGINRLANGIRIRCATEEQAEQLRAIDWDEAFKGIKIHEPNYGIVINGVPKDELDLDDPNTTKLLEAANNLPSGTISKVTFLRRKDKDKELSTKTKHCSIVIYFKNYYTANKCITNGCYINYVHYQPKRFVPQFQIIQCFNCYEYGHRAANCKRKPRCGKCAGKHNTKECNSTTVQCALCKNPHEAWRHECSARVAEKHRLEELRDRCPDLFTI